MKRLFYIVALLFVAVACEKEASFSCRVIEHGVEGVTETSATLSATVYASNYGAIDRMGRVEEDEAVDIVEVSLREFPEFAGLVAVLFHGLAGLTDQSRRGGVLLEAAVASAGTRDAVHLDGHVADLPRRTVDAGQELPVEDDAAADAGAEGDHHEVLHTLSVTVYHLTDSCSVSIVGQKDKGRGEVLLHICHQVEQTTALVGVLLVLT